ncbi:MAG: hypothetical protein ACJAZQ_001993, partial [Cognaticolwellia sp.]
MRCSPDFDLYWLIESINQTVLVTVGKG